MKSRLLGISVIVMVGLIMGGSLYAQSSISNRFESEHYVSFSDVENGFPLCNSAQIAPILIATDDFAGVYRVASHLQNDIRMVTGKEPNLVTGNNVEADFVVIIGTIGKSSLINKLVDNNKLDVSDVEGRWEVSLIQVVEEPFPGVKKALVIVGSDKRGTVFGMFDLSAQMGVSPWYWWADVPVVQHDNVFVNHGRYNLGEPKVKYRGIFINDEAPALSGWVFEKFGGFNADFYAHVFELILRLKGNFLWPAMWGRSIYDDDPRSPQLANEYGVVISTSHHEPMMRAHVEWERYGKGPWNYDKNTAVLHEFWRKGIVRMDDNESVVTVGMRGDGDEPMSNDRNIDLLTRIVDNQRSIIEDVTGFPASEKPQVWALYKEVQDYYDMGMRVPDDITLLYCDDNWGNVRRMPGDEERARSGGSGMYYHFDYVGGPRNYKWINTNPLPKIWEQNKLAYAHGIDRIWVVNVGDIKPMEFPTQFYLDLAWNPDRFEADDIAAYSVTWARQQFGDEYATQIASFLDQYGKINGRRKPELLDWNTFALNNYREFERVVNEYNALADSASAVNDLMPENYRDAYYQLVLYPIEASANLYNLYYATARNHFYADQLRVSSNQLADSVTYFFNRDSLLSVFYNTKVAEGKWNHMMDQTRIGYTYWQEPPVNVMPQTIRILPKKGTHAGLFIEGQEQAFSELNNKLPEFDVFNRQCYYFELFNQGDQPFNYRIKSSDKWVVFSSDKGTVDDQKRIFVSVNWNEAPYGTAQAVIHVKTGKSTMDVNLTAWKPSNTEMESINGFVESNGYVSMESSHFSKLNESDAVKWIVIPDIGRTLDGVIAQPYRVEEQIPGQGPSIEYPVYLKKGGKVKVYAYFSPTLNYSGGEGLKYAIAFNDQQPMVVNTHADESPKVWEGMVSNQSMWYVTEHLVDGPGQYTLKFFMVSPGLVLQKIVIDTGGLKPSYLGPPESFLK